VGTLFSSLVVGEYIYIYIYIYNETVRKGEKIQKLPVIIIKKKMTEWS